MEESFAISRRRAGGSADYFLVTEYAENGDLYDYLQREWIAWTPAKVRREAVALLRLLGMLHGNGITHRDLTPANILVTGDKRLKVGDWGIARTSVGTVLAGLDGQNPLFTPSGFKGLPRDDTWMVGQLMAMLLSADASESWTVKQVMAEDWDSDLKRVMERALGPVSSRYATAYDMLADLEHSERKSSRLRSLRGKCVCFTGPLEDATRRQARRELTRAGGIYQTGVGRNTDVLVRGRLSPMYIRGTEGTKLAKAKECGTKVIQEPEFWRLVARTG